MKKLSVVEKRQRELLRIRKQEGLLTAEIVVEQAKSPKSALHDWFEWDDVKASHEYRLWQARQLIVSVQVLPRGSSKATVAFVSLKSDRARDGGGYRETVSVLSDARMRTELIRQALDDFRYWREKYRTLAELAEIFEAGDKTISTFNRKTG